MAPSMDDTADASLLSLALVGRLRERKAQARSQRARRVSRALEQTYRRCESTLADLTSAQDQARAAQLQHLQAGRVAFGLQNFIDMAERRRRCEQAACALAHERWRASLEDVRHAARALAASEERRNAYDELLAQWRADARERMDEEDEGG